MKISETINGLDLHDIFKWSTAEIETYLENISSEDFKRDLFHTIKVAKDPYVYERYVTKLSFKNELALAKKNPIIEKALLLAEIVFMGIDYSSRNREFVDMKKFLIYYTVVNKERTDRFNVERLFAHFLERDRTTINVNIHNTMELFKDARFLKNIEPLSSKLPPLPENHREIFTSKLKYYINKKRRIHGSN